VSAEAAAAAPASGGRDPVAVRVAGLAKTFPGTRALDGVDLEIREGEIHALCGGNGSGKSTLIKILCGVYDADPGGAITVGDTEVAADRMTPEIARAAGVRVVHQDLAVFPDLSVAENLAVGIGYRTGPMGAVSWSSVRRDAAALIERFEIPAAPQTLVRDLTVAGRTQVAIARAMGDAAGRPRLLILDEPTAALPVHEVELLLRALRRYADAGTAILYVSHRLDEVLGLADRVTVLRDGAVVGTRTAADLDEQGLIGLMLGAAAQRALATATTSDTAVGEVADMTPVLEVRDLASGPVRGVDLTVRAGEVVGIAGLMGSGRTELLQAIYGLAPREAGTVRLDGEPVRYRDCAGAIAAGVVHVPENRLADGVFLQDSVAANLDVSVIDRFWRGLGFRTRRMRAEADELVDAFRVRTPSVATAIGSLSGGNQQKVVLARWLRRGPRLLLLDEPTQGVDVGARADIYAAVRRATDAGAAAVVVASDMEELAEVADRVLVLRAGRVVAEVPGADLSAHLLTELSYSGTYGA
jgi:ribose transport system ATP-binding protein